MSNIEKYVSDGEVQRSKIALDVADGSLSPVAIQEFCSDQRIKNAFIGTSYSKKKPKEKWDSAYLDQIVCAAAAESFNQDYLLYLAEVGAHVRNKKPNNNVKLIVGVVVAVAIIAVIVGIITWKANKTEQSPTEETFGQYNDGTSQSVSYDEM